MKLQVSLVITLLAFATPLALAKDLVDIPVNYLNTLPPTACGSGAQLNDARTQCILKSGTKPKAPNCAGQPPCPYRVGEPYCPPGACGTGTSCAFDPLKWPLTQNGGWACSGECINPS
ncbi:hypothetical protein BJ684DRAFT_16441 [Piptocephalis cylindrospora]|uniref:Uncharacterized protein n=1 Tax=Piptocephalis cylindrospora TaxID=1907219 RepID=A0A4P9Y2P7_9FUNG|nr:hypothetical protein BJ684DRAFT_16441 [Piptocephalis cylindrospora]|eukprot:RKP13127.1 hypothetical protein BJ684DRAFT_16441 [Piptocephalis cylindrospora]